MVTKDLSPYLKGRKTRRDKLGAYSCCVPTVHLKQNQEEQNNLYLKKHVHLEYNIYLSLCLPEFLKYIY